MSPSLSTSVLLVLASSCLGRAERVRVNELLTTSKQELQQSRREDDRPCQYLPRIGRPESPTGDWKEKFVYLEDGWSKSGFLNGKGVTLAECREHCDKIHSCVGFVRLAKENGKQATDADMFYLDEVELMVKSKTAKFTEAQFKQYLLKTPEDYGRGECWLLKSGSYKSLGGLRRLKLDTKYLATSNREKVTYEQRNCGCQFRYLGLPRIRSPQEDMSVVETKPIPPDCEGIFKFLPREFTPTIENIYQKLSIQLDKTGKVVAKVHFLFTCGKHGDGESYDRRWYCAAAQDMVEFQDELRRALETKSATASTLGAFAMGSKTLRKINRQTIRDMLNPNMCGGSPVSDIIRGPVGWSPDRVVKGGTSKSVVAINSCSATKDSASELQRLFRVSQVGRCGIDDPELESNVAQAKAWLNGNLIKLFKMDKVRLQEVVEALIRVMARITRIGNSTDEWERTACASELIDIVLNVKGIFPKVAQNLANRPDLIKDEFVRNVLKQTQTENKAATNEEIEEYLKQQNVSDDGVPIADLVDLNSAVTIGTGSVGQVLLVKVKAPKLMGKLGNKDKAVLKVVFQENERRYDSDWSLLEYVSNWVKWLQEKLSETDNSFGGTILRTLNRATYDISIPTAVTKTSELFAKLKESMMDEFDLNTEARFTELGSKFVNEVHGLRNNIVVKVPAVSRTSSKYALFQELATGVVLKRHLTNIEGSPMELVAWKQELFDAIIKTYGHLVLKRGFWQTDPHPGNWLYDSSGKILWLIDWGAVGDFYLNSGSHETNNIPDKTKGDEHTAAGPAFHCRLARFYQGLSDRVKERREKCDTVTVTARASKNRHKPWLSGQVELFSGGTTTDLESKQASHTYHGEHPDGGHIVLYRDDDFGWTISHADPNAADVSTLLVPRLRCQNQDRGSPCRAYDISALSVETMFEAVSNKDKEPAMNVMITKSMASSPICEKDGMTHSMALLSKTLGFEAKVAHSRDTWQKDEDNVLALFAALLNTDLDELVQRATFEDPNADVMIPTHALLLVRTLQAFIAMLQDLAGENPPPLVPKFVNEFIRSSAFDNLLQTWEPLARDAVDRYDETCALKR